VETYLVIFLTWVTPGIVLCAYLLWLSKRVRRSSRDIQANPRGPIPDDTGPRQRK
jgi:hypothetical protein